MHKMLAGKIVSLTLLMIVLFAVKGSLQARDDTPLIPVLFAQSDDSIAFYGLDNHNTLVEMGHLPENFDLTPYWDSDRSSGDTETRWLSNWWNMNVVLSPDGSQIALTASSPVPDQDAINFYIFLYNVQSDDLQQAYTTVWSGEPRTDLHWSPDSRAILIEPTYGESPAFQPPYAESFVYLLDTGGIMLENEHYWEMGWGEDSTTLREIGLVLANPYDNTRHTIHHLGNQGSSASENQGPACNYIWSAGLKRWYFVSPCDEDSDINLGAIYSTALNGNMRLEVDLKAYLTEQFGLTADVSTAIRIHNSDLFAHDGNVYAVLLFSYPSDSGDYGFYSEARIIQIDDTSRVEPVLINASREPNPYFRYAFPAPDYQRFAFVSDVLGSSQVVIGDLVNKAMIGQYIRPDSSSSGASWRYWMGRWIDNERFIYEDMQDVWLFDVSDGTFTNLTDDMEPQAWLLPQTNSN
ncbi:MAG: hypothetical protein ABI690_00710 [Chloroflexota bacterium]